MKEGKYENWKKCEHCGVWIYAIDYLCPTCRREYELEIEKKNKKQSRKNYRKN
jgi:uncharacterized OB-fold protein